MKDETPGIDALFDEADAVAGEALELLFALRPGLRDGYDARMRRLAREDMAHHVRHLAAVSLDGEGAALIDYLSWLKVLFDGLGIPDDLIALSLRCAGRAAARRLGPAAAAGFEELAERAAREYGRSEPALNRYLKEGLPGNGIARAYVQALIEGRKDLAESLVNAAASEGTSVRRLYLELFQPAQRELGRLWLLRKISVAQEHFATAATQYIMSTLYPALFSGSRPNGKRVIAACAQGELHEIGIRMVSDFFQAEGWDSRYLGANLPVSALVEEVGRSAPDLVALSATVSTNLRWVEKAIGELRSLAGPRIPVLVGGAPFAVSPGLCRELGADATALDCETATSAGAALVGLPPAGEGAPA